MKAKELRKMGREERERKLGELRLELIKSKVNASKTGSSKKREIKKIIARILTLNKK
ncbi:MAG TPA: 50S ribosomal protein L29 [Candidatus Pacearchaeota archaeon]|nr:50S ribosomal protein L29 [Candidatus Pacearchaeota archaeon]